MNIISPSILSADFGNLERDIIKVRDAGAKYIHIDVMDGHFVPNISLGAPVQKSVSHIENIVFDTHLMIETPEIYLDDFINAGSDIITFHIESTQKADYIIKYLKEKDIKVGISVKPKTKVEDIFKYLDNIDMVLIMTVEPGFGGQSFMEDMLPKIKALRAEINKRKLAVDIEVDGGINLETMKKVVDAGANVIVAGSYIYGAENIDETIKEMLNI